VKGDIMIIVILILILIGIGTMIGYLKEISNQNKELIKLLKNRGDYDA